MFNEVLKAGSYIVDALRVYKQRVVMYVPKGASMVGGALVVISKSINPGKIEFWVDPSAKLSILEVEGGYQAKFKKHIPHPNKAVMAAVELHSRSNFGIPGLQIVDESDLRNRLTSA